ncbi:efflux RND transporter periplasmic adaptor subunit [Nocardiopsis sp. CNT312]|uniref:efflux RND transporter periplasmic adaptor subunit n=1 Tax=Nocardiopsis sp. CNT312 TaxID=1137268 RepID=UPI0004BC2482|nr:efflux RND transporter periplasmic adaptor subunit [Nocardiopsis sp. CNT312]
MVKKRGIVAGAALLLLAVAVGGGYVLFQRLLGGTPPAEFPLNQAAADMGGTPHEVGTAAISSVMVLDATVRRAPGEDVTAREGGTVTRVWVSDGDAVDNGAPILTLAVPGGPAPEGDGAAPGTREVVLHSPDAGVVSGLGDLWTGDTVEPGTAVAEVAQEEFRAVANVPPNDLYRFVEDPEDITLRIEQGPADITCTFLSLGTVPAGAQEAAGDGGGEAGAELVCRIPAGVDVFEGVRGELSVAAAEVSGVVAVPVTAVRGGGGEGEVMVVAGDGGHEPREVSLGVTDGSMIEVTEGLRVGESVLDPVPLDPRFDVPGAYDPAEGFRGLGPGTVFEEEG